MALSHSPRKLIPLSTGEEKLGKPPGPTSTTRVFFCGVVVENAENGRELPPDVQDLIASLGDPLDLDTSPSSIPSSSDSKTEFSQANNEAQTRRRAMTNTSALVDVVNEFVGTERNYVKRLRSLKVDYADPLRNFSRSKDTAIIPPYEAKTLFGNVDQLLPVHEAFLHDLELMQSPDGPKTVGGIGDVALKHFKQLRGFEHYKQFYAKREEAQTIFEREIKRSSGFAAFIDRIKYSSADNKNRVGLRELMMEPVQRIPRYTLLFRQMMKHMAASDSQRAKLLEADELASKIASADDEQTTRAAILHCIHAAVEDSPADLISNSRKFIDCIDVQDLISDTPNTPSSSAGGLGTLTMQCSLFLFDDKLMIVRRTGGGDKGARALSGLDDLDKSSKSRGFPFSSKKTGMISKGVIDVTEVVATDVGGADFHLYLENPPPDPADRLSARQFRAYSVVFPPQAVYLDPKRTEAEKQRFLDNLWAVQARYRTRAGQSVALYAEEREVENRAGKITRARTFFNIYQRTEFLREPKKTKIVVHIDPLGGADPIPFGVRGPPLVVIRIQPMPGELSRYAVTSNDSTDEPEEDIVQNSRVPGRIIQTIHQYGLFKFRTGNSSMPSTPTAKSRAAIFGLDTISRNLFSGSRPDIFGGSINSHRRSKTPTTGSRTSMYTQSTSTTGSSLIRTRSDSITTAATSIEDGPNSISSKNSRRSRSIQKAKKFIKRGKSPASGEDSEPDSSPTRPGSSLSQSVMSAYDRSRSPSLEPESAYDGFVDQDGLAYHAADQSERDLVARLELARKNGQSQGETNFGTHSTDVPIEEIIYEETPPQPLRSSSRASRDLPEIPQEPNSLRSTTPQPDYLSVYEPSQRSRSRSSDRQSIDHRRFGPRTPSPQPFARTPSASTDDLFAMDADDDHQDPLVTPVVSPMPRSRRQPFNIDATPRAAARDDPARMSSIVEPLSIRKNPSLRENREAPNLDRRLPPIKQPSFSNVMISTKPLKLSTVDDDVNVKDVEQLLKMSEITQDNLGSARHTLKRIKLEAEHLRNSTVSTPASEIERQPSPIKGLRLPQRSNNHNNQPITKEAQARMEEMQRLIGKRLGESSGGPPRGLHLSMASESAIPRQPHSIPDSPRLDGTAHIIEDLTTHADGDIAKAMKSQSLMIPDLQDLISSLKEKSTELARMKIELQNTRRQCEVAKQLLADSTAENEIMYEAFNEELDGMFNDASLPEDEAWLAISKDLQHTKQSRNELQKENSHLKRQLAELELQNEELSSLLRVHGLIV